MKRTIIFTALLATAVGLFALGDMQRQAERMQNRTSDAALPMPGSLDG